MAEPLLDIDLPGIKLFKKGKVRNVFDLGDSLLLVASDRISAFDSCYSRKCPVTTLNSVSSVVGDRQRDFITFRPFENPVNNSLINDTVFNLNDPFG